MMMLEMRFGISNCTLAEIGKEFGVDKQNVSRNINKTLKAFQGEDPKEIAHYIEKHCGICYKREPETKNIMTKLYSIEQVAEKLNVSRGCVDLWIRRGKIKCVMEIKKTPVRRIPENEYRRMKRERSKR